MKSEQTCLPAGQHGVLICLHADHLVALHGFIKKTKTTPTDDLELARKRQKEVQQ
jgi:phage-related protein